MKKSTSTTVESSDVEPVRITTVSCFKENVAKGNLTLRHVFDIIQREGSPAGVLLETWGGYNKGYMKPVGSQDFALRYLSSRLGKIAGPGRVLVDSMDNEEQDVVLDIQQFETRVGFSEEDITEYDKIRKELIAAVKVGDDIARLLSVKDKTLSEYHTNQCLVTLTERILGREFPGSFHISNFYLFMLARVFGKTEAMKPSDRSSNMIAPDHFATDDNLGLKFELITEKDIHALADEVGSHAGWRSSRQPKPEGRVIETPKQEIYQEWGGWS